MFDRWTHTIESVDRLCVVCVRSRIQMYVCMYVGGYVILGRRTAYVAVLHCCCKGDNSTHKSKQQHQISRGRSTSPLLFFFFSFFLFSFCMPPLTTDLLKKSCSRLGRRRGAHRGLEGGPRRDALDVVGEIGVGVQLDVGEEARDVREVCSGGGTVGRWVGGWDKRETVGGGRRRMATCARRRRRTRQPRPRPRIARPRGKGSLSAAGPALRKASPSARPRAALW